MSLAAAAYAYVFFLMLEVICFDTSVQGQSTYKNLMHCVKLTLNSPPKLYFSNKAQTLFKAKHRDVQAQFLGCKAVLVFMPAAFRAVEQYYSKQTQTHTCFFHWYA